MNLPELLTPRLLIRSIRETDGPACLDFWLDEEMGRYLADPPRAKASDACLNFAVGLDQDDWYPLVALHRESGGFPGACSAVPWKTDGTFRKRGTDIVYREIVYRLETPPLSAER